MSDTELEELIKRTSKRSSILGPLLLEKAQKLLLKRRKKPQLIKDDEKRASAKLATWDGHVVDPRNSKLLTAIFNDWPNTFVGVQFNSEFMWTVALNALCHLVRELMIVSLRNRDLTLNNVNNLKNQILDIESMFCFKLDWTRSHLHIIKLRTISRPHRQLIGNMKRRELVSEQIDCLRSELRILEHELEFLKKGEEGDIYGSEFVLKRGISDAYINTFETFIVNGIVPSYKV